MTTNNVPPFGGWPAAFNSLSAEQLQTIHGLTPVVNNAQVAPNPPASMWSPKPGDFYFETPAHVQYFVSKRQQMQVWNAGHRNGPSWTENDELELVNKLHIDWYDEPWQSGGHDWTSAADELNLDAIKPTITPNRKLSPFKIAYQTYAEARLRLMNTVIVIKNSPFYVNRVKQKDNDFVLGVVKSNSEQSKKVLLSAIGDLRTIQPMYITTNSTGWLCRMPARVFQQGINRNNTIVRTVDGKSHLYNVDAMSLIKAIDKRVDKEWHSSYEGLMESGELASVRLSDDMAVAGPERVCCYRGRPLGNVHKGEVFVEDEDDLQQQWIERSAKKVGLELRAA